MRVDRVVPPTYANVFSYGTFNSMQSKLVHQAFDSDENMVIAAPTGSGKTVIHELAICRLHLSKGTSMKVVYVAPSKALCQQRWTEWEQKFSPFGLRVLEVTGDIDLKDCLRLVAKASIIITTPEKWDSLTRVWRDHIYLLTATDLLLLDEIHHLGEDRGPTLETVIVRMRVLAKVREEQMKANPTLSFDINQQSVMRIIALSATLPNINDIGEWLTCKPNAVHSFDDTFRPVRLNVHTLCYGSAHSPFLFERSLDSRVPDLIKRFSNNRQTLIFCSSKKGTENLAMILLKDPSLRRVLPASLQQEEALHNMKDEALKDIIQRGGIAYHHAGLPPDDRAIVEQLFLTGHVKILCSTSTLAHGVNLPAHLVIVKGTLSWRGSGKGYERLRRSDVIQMLGRAGRPGYDDFGTALIMTSDEDKSFYSQVTTSAEMVISSLPTMLHEVFVSEISQRVITSLEDCLLWIKSTFFYTCLKKGRLHDIKNVINSEEDLERYISQLAIKVMHDLRTGGLISFPDQTNNSHTDINSNHTHITPLQEAHIMCRYLTHFKSMLILLQIPPHSKLPTLLTQLSHCEELHKPVRKAEKKILNDCLPRLRFPSQDMKRVTTSAQKCVVLMQTAVSRIEQCIHKDFTLKIEQAEIIDSSLRLLHCLQDIAVYYTRGILLETVLLLSRALHVRLWETPNENLFLQCRDLPSDLLYTIDASHLKHPLLVYGMTCHQIVSEFHCSVRDATVIMTFAREFAHSKLQVTPSFDSQRLTLTITPAVEISSGQTGIVSEIIQYHLICYATTTGKLICHRKLPKRTMNTIVTLDWHEESEGEFAKLRCCLICENVVGLDSFAGAPPAPAADIAEVVTGKKSVSKVKDSNSSANKSNAAGKQQKTIITALPAIATTAATTAGNSNIHGNEEKVNNQTQEELFQGSVQGKVSRVTSTTTTNPPPSFPARLQQQSQSQPLLLQQKENHPPTANNNSSSSNNNPFSQFSLHSSSDDTTPHAATTSNNTGGVVPFQLQKIRKQAYDTNITDVSSIKRLKTSATSQGHGYGQGQGQHYVTPADLLQRQAMNTEANIASQQQQRAALVPQKFFENPVRFSSSSHLHSQQEVNELQQAKSQGFFDFNNKSLPHAPPPAAAAAAVSGSQQSAGRGGGSAGYSLFVPAPTPVTTQTAQEAEQEEKAENKPFCFLAAQMKKQQLPAPTLSTSAPSTLMDVDFDDAFM